MQNGNQTINIYSIFRSINGEICKPGQGSWATFIRFAGCNLEPKCTYCDTEYAQDFNSGNEWTVNQIVNRVNQLNCNNVTITGGEPLAQRNNLHNLIHALRFKNISIETNGTFPIIDPLPHERVSWIVDYKLPSSGANQQMAPTKPWHQLSYTDYIKFVIDTSDRRDYDVALAKVQQFWSEGIKAQIIFSPIIELSPWSDTHIPFVVNKLYGWMKENQLFQVLLNLQLHKLVGLDEEK